jgi:hypothetical protein
MDVNPEIRERILNAEQQLFVASGRHFRKGTATK